MRTSRISLRTLSIIGIAVATLSIVLQNSPLTGQLTLLGNASGKALREIVNERAMERIKKMKGRKKDAEIMKEMVLPKLTFTKERAQEGVVLKADDQNEFSCPAGTVTPILHRTMQGNDTARFWVYQMTEAGQEPAVRKLFISEGELTIHPEWKDGSNIIRFDGGETYWLMTDTDLFFSCGTEGGIAQLGVCGNDTKENDEQCDDGNEDETDECLNDCTLRISVTCGNGEKDEGEECDDGGESATCDTNCTAVACGDDIHNATAGEECDDGNTDDGDGCSADCKTETSDTCGNGTVETGEQCDANGEDSEQCDSDCTLAECGDSYKNETAGEFCDDGNDIDDDDCNNQCTEEEIVPISQCGDGKVEGKEKCDPGTHCESGDQCTNDSDCGDGSACTLRGTTGCTAECLTIEDPIVQGWCCNSTLGSCSSSKPTECESANYYATTDFENAQASCNTVCSGDGGGGDGPPESCGNGKVDFEKGEECDGGEDCTDKCKLKTDAELAGCKEGQIVRSFVMRPAGDLRINDHVNFASTVDDTENGTFFEQQKPLYTRIKDPVSISTPFELNPSQQLSTDFILVHQGSTAEKTKLETIDLVLEPDGGEFPEDFQKASRVITRLSTQWAIADKEGTFVLVPQVRNNLEYNKGSREAAYMEGKIEGFGVNYGTPQRFPVKYTLKGDRPSNIQVRILEGLSKLVASLIPNQTHQTIRDFASAKVVPETLLTIDKGEEVNFNTREYWDDAYLRIHSIMHAETEAEYRLHSASVTVEYCAGEPKSACFDVCSVADCTSGQCGKKEDGTCGCLGEDPIDECKLETPPQTPEMSYGYSSWDPVDRKIYFIGGNGEISTYDFDTNTVENRATAAPSDEVKETWLTSNAWPTIVWSPLDKSAYFVGSYSRKNEDGSLHPDGRPLGVIAKYDSEKDEFSEVTRLDPPVAYPAAGYSPIDGKIYIFGGATEMYRSGQKTESRTTSVTTFDPSTGVLEKVADTPEAVDQYSMWDPDNKVFLLRSVSGGKTTQWAFDPATRETTAIPIFNAVYGVGRYKDQAYDPLEKVIYEREGYKINRMKNTGERIEKVGLTLNWNTGRSSVSDLIYDGKTDCFYAVTQGAALPHYCPREEEDRKATCEETGGTTGGGTGGGGGDPSGENFCHLDGLKHYWTLNEPDGKRLDSRGDMDFRTMDGSNHQGLETNGVRGVDALQARGAEFTKDDHFDYLLSEEASPTLTENTSHTIAFWFKWDGSELNKTTAPIAGIPNAEKPNGEIQHMISRIDDDGNGYYIGLYRSAYRPDLPDGDHYRVYARMMNGDKSMHAIGIAEVKPKDDGGHLTVGVEKDRFYHVRLDFTHANDREDGSHVLHLSVQPEDCPEGHVCGSGNGMSSKDFVPPTSDTYIIVGRPQKGNEQHAGFNGVIDELGIWERNLSTNLLDGKTEISYLFNNGKGVPYSSLNTCLKEAPPECKEGEKCEETGNQIICTEEGEEAVSTFETKESSLHGIDYLGFSGEQGKSIPYNFDNEGWLEHVVQKSLKLHVLQYDANGYYKSLASFNAPQIFDLSTADVNEDGLDDILYLSRGTGMNSSQDVVNIITNNGDSFSKKEYRTTLKYYFVQPRYAGDGIITFGPYNLRISDGAVVRKAGFPVNTAPGAVSNKGWKAPHKFVYSAFIPKSGESDLYNVRKDPNDIVLADSEGTILDRGLHLAGLQQLEIADLNGDGTDDIIGAFYSGHYSKTDTARIEWWDGESLKRQVLHETLQYPEEIPGFAHHIEHIIRAGDMNGDTKVDIAVVSRVDSSDITVRPNLAEKENSITYWLENAGEQGGNISLKERLIEIGTNPDADARRNITIGDFDGDDYLDIATDGTVNRLLFQTQTCGVYKNDVLPTVCGNGIKQAGEECDDGNTNNIDECSNECTKPVCGDGVRAGDEQCDKGAENGPDSNCSNECISQAICGDGVLADSEECDDGNTTDEGWCRANCTHPQKLSCNEGDEAKLTFTQTVVSGAADQVKPADANNDGTYDLYLRRGTSVSVLENEGNNSFKGIFTQNHGSGDGYLDVFNTDRYANSDAILTRSHTRYSAPNNTGIREDNIYYHHIDNANTITSKELEWLYTQDRKAQTIKLRKTGEMLGVFVQDNSIGIYQVKDPRQKNSAIDPMYSNRTFNYPAQSFLQNGAVPFVSFDLEGSVSSGLRSVAKIKLSNGDVIESDAGNYIDFIDVESGDFNNDGTEDFVAVSRYRGSNGSNSSIEWWDGKTRKREMIMETLGGQPKQPTGVSTSVMKQAFLAVGDIDRDGDDDIAVAVNSPDPRTQGETDGDLLYWIESDNGSWIRHMISKPAGVVDIALQDMNDDGYLDIVTTGAQTLVHTQSQACGKKVEPDPTPEGEICTDGVDNNNNGIVDGYLKLIGKREFRSNRYYSLNRQSNTFDPKLSNHVDATAQFATVDRFTEITKDGKTIYSVNWRNNLGKLYMDVVKFRTSDFTGLDAVAIEVNKKEFEDLGLTPYGNMNMEIDEVAQKGYLLKRSWANGVSLAKLHVIDLKTMTLLDTLPVLENGTKKPYVYEFVVDGKNRRGYFLGEAVIGGRAQTALFSLNLDTLETSDPIVIGDDTNLFYSNRGGVLSISDDEKYLYASGYYGSTGRYESVLLRWNIDGTSLTNKKVMTIDPEPFADNVKMQHAISSNGTYVGGIYVHDEEARKATFLAPDEKTEFFVEPNGNQAYKMVTHSKENAMGQYTDIAPFFGLPENSTALQSYSAGRRFFVNAARKLLYTCGDMHITGIGGRMSCNHVHIYEFHTEDECEKEPIDLKPSGSDPDKEIASVKNANPDANGTSVPTGVSPIGQFKLTAGTEGEGTPRVRNILFSINATNVELKKDTISVYNKADTTKKKTCTVKQLGGSVVTSNPTGSLIALCENIHKSLDSTISGDTTLVLEAEVFNPQVDSSKTSALQVSLQKHSQFGSFTFGQTGTHIEWDHGEGSTVQQRTSETDAVIKSTSYQSEVRITECNDGKNNDTDSYSDYESSFVGRFVNTQGWQAAGQSGYEADSKMSPYFSVRDAKFHLLSPDGEYMYVGLYYGRGIRNSSSIDSLVKLRTKDMSFVSGLYINTRNHNTFANMHGVIHPSGDSLYIMLYGFSPGNKSKDQMDLIKVDTASMNIVNTKTMNRSEMERTDLYSFSGLTYAWHDDSLYTIGRKLRSSILKIDPETLAITKTTSIAAYPVDTEEILYAPHTKSLFINNAVGGKQSIVQYNLETETESVHNVSEGYITPIYQTKDKKHLAVQYREQVGGAPQYHVGFFNLDNNSVVQSQKSSPESIIDPATGRMMHIQAGTLDSTTTSPSDPDKGLLSAYKAPLNANNASNYLYDWNKRRAYITSNPKIEVIQLGDLECESEEDDDESKTTFDTSVMTYVPPAPAIAECKDEKDNDDDGIIDGRLRYHGRLQSDGFYQGNSLRCTNCYQYTAYRSHTTGRQPSFRLLNPDGNKLYLGYYDNISSSGDPMSDKIIIVRTDGMHIDSVVDIKEGTNEVFRDTYATMDPTGAHIYITVSETGSRKAQLKILKYSTSSMALVSSKVYTIDDLNALGLSSGRVSGLAYSPENNTLYTVGYFSTEGIVSIDADTLEISKRTPIELPTKTRIFESAHIHYAPHTNTLFVPIYRAGQTYDIIAYNLTDNTFTRHQTPGRYPSVVYQSKSGDVIGIVHDFPLTTALYNLKTDSIITSSSGTDSHTAIDPVSGKFIKLKEVGTTGTVQATPISLPSDDHIAGYAGPFYGGGGSPFIVNNESRKAYIWGVVNSLGIVELGDAGCTDENDPTEGDELTLPDPLSFGGTTHSSAGSCDECGKCGEGLFNVCDQAECEELGPCTYSNRTCTPDPVECKQPAACEDGKDNDTDGTIDTLPVAKEAEDPSGGITVSTAGLTSAGKHLDSSGEYFYAFYYANLGSAGRTDLLTKTRVRDGAVVKQLSLSLGNHAMRTGYMAIHPDGKTAYVQISQSSPSVPTGSVDIARINLETMTLEKKNTLPYSTFSSKGLFTSNYDLTYSLHDNSLYTTNAKAKLLRIDAESLELTETISFVDRNFNAGMSPTIPRGLYVPEEKTLFIPGTFFDNISAPNMQNREFGLIAYNTETKAQTAYNLGKTYNAIQPIYLSANKKYLAVSYDKPLSFNNFVGFLNLATKTIVEEAEIGNRKGAFIDPATGSIFQKTDLVKNPNLVANDTRAISHGPFFVEFAGGNFVDWKNRTAHTRSNGMFTLPDSGCSNPKDEDEGGDATVPALMTESSGGGFVAQLAACEDGKDNDADTFKDHGPVAEKQLRIYNSNVYDWNRDANKWDLTTAGSVGDIVAKGNSSRFTVSGDEKYAYVTSVYNPTTDTRNTEIHLTTIDIENMKVLKSTHIPFRSDKKTEVGARFFVHSAPVLGTDENVLYLIYVYREQNSNSAGKFYNEILKINRSTHAIVSRESIGEGKRIEHPEPVFDANNNNIYVRTFDREASGKNKWFIADIDATTLKTDRSMPLPFNTTLGIGYTTYPYFDRDDNAIYIGAKTGTQNAYYKIPVHNPDNIQTFNLGTRNIRQNFVPFRSAGGETLLLGHETSDRKGIVPVGLRTDTWKEISISPNRYGYILDPLSRKMQMFAADGGGETTFGVPLRVEERPVNYISKFSPIGAVSRKRYGFESQGKFTIWNLGDPGCNSADDENESDSTAYTPWSFNANNNLSTECSNGKDDDNDGTVDMYDDSCTDADGNYHPEYDDEKKVLAPKKADMSISFNAIAQSSAKEIYDIFMMPKNNSLDADAENVKTRITVPSNVDIIHNVNCTKTGNTVECSFGTVEKNKAKVASFSINLKNTTPCTDTINVGSVSVSTTTEESDMSNNSSSTISLARNCPTVSSKTDIELTSTLTPSPTSETTMILEFTAKNTSVTDAGNVKILQDMPTGVSSLYGGTCLVNSGGVDLTCLLGTIKAGEEKKQTITILLPTSASCSQEFALPSGTAESSTEESTLDNNTVDGRTLTRNCAGGGGNSDGYNATDDCWDERIMPRPMSVFGVAQKGADMYTFGGNGQTGDPDKQYLKLQVFKTRDARSWTTQSADYPYKTATNVAQFNGKFYTVGSDTLDDNANGDPVYESTDGRTWIQVGTLGFRPTGYISSIFAGTADAALTAHNGKLWLSTGYRDGPAVIYSSLDGKRWTSVTRNGPRGRNTQLISFDGKLWMITARKATTYGYTTNIYSSSNGSSWTKVHDIENRHNAAATVYDSKLWILGGINQQGKSSQPADTIYYTDGTTLKEAPFKLPHHTLAGGQALSHSGRLWFLGGQKQYAHGFGGLDPRGFSTAAWSIDAKDCARISETTSGTRPPNLPVATENGTVTIQKPSNGTLWQTRNLYKIDWNTTGVVKNDDLMWKIDASTNNGSTWTDISAYIGHAVNPSQISDIHIFTSEEECIHMTKDPRCPTIASSYPYIRVKQDTLNVSKFTSFKTLKTNDTVKLRVTAYRFNRNATTSFTAFTPIGSKETSFRVQFATGPLPDTNSACWEQYKPPTGVTIEHLVEHDGKRFLFIKDGSDRKLYSTVDGEVWTNERSDWPNIDGYPVISNGRFYYVQKVSYSGAWKIWRLEDTKVWRELNFAPVSTIRGSSRIIYDTVTYKNKPYFIMIDNGNIYVTTFTDPGGTANIVPSLVQEIRYSNGLKYNTPFAFTANDNTGQEYMYIIADLSTVTGQNAGDHFFKSNSSGTNFSTTTATFPTYYRTSYTEQAHFGGGKVWSNQNDILLSKTTLASCNYSDFPTSAVLQEPDTVAQTLRECRDTTDEWLEIDGEVALEWYDTVFVGPKDLMVGYGSFKKIGDRVYHWAPLSAKVSIYELVNDKWQYRANQYDVGEMNVRDVTQFGGSDYMLAGLRENGTWTHKAHLFKRTGESFTPVGAFVSSNPYQTRLGIINNALHVLAHDGAYRLNGSSLSKVISWTLPEAPNSGDYYQFLDLETYNNQIFHVSRRQPGNGESHAFKWSGSSWVELSRNGGAALHNSTGFYEDQGILYMHGPSQHYKWNGSRWDFIDYFARVQDGIAFKTFYTLDKVECKFVGDSSKPMTLPNNYGISKPAYNDAPEPPPPVVKDKCILMPKGKETFDAREVDDRAACDALAVNHCNQHEYGLVYYVRAGAGGAISIYCEGPEVRCDMINSRTATGMSGIFKRSTNPEECIRQHYSTGGSCGWSSSKGKVIEFDREIIHICGATHHQCSEDEENNWSVLPGTVKAVRFSNLPPHNVTIDPNRPSTTSQKDECYTKNIFGSYAKTGSCTGNSCYVKQYSCGGGDYDGVQKKYFIADDGYTQCSNCNQGICAQNDDWDALFETCSNNTFVTTSVPRRMNMTVIHSRLQTNPSSVPTDCLLKAAKEEGSSLEILRELESRGEDGDFLREIAWYSSIHNSNYISDAQAYLDGATEPNCTLWDDEWRTQPMHRVQEKDISTQSACENSFGTLCTNYPGRRVSFNRTKIKDCGDLTTNTDKMIVRQPRGGDTWYRGSNRIRMFRYIGGAATTAQISTNNGSTWQTIHTKNSPPNNVLILTDNEQCRNSVSATRRNFCPTSTFDYPQLYNAATETFKKIEASTQVKLRITQDNNGTDIVWTSNTFTISTDDPPPWWNDEEAHDLVASRNTLTASLTEQGSSESRLPILSLLAIACLGLAGSVLYLKRR